MNDLYIDFLAEELLKEKLVVFVGAGASIDSNLPSWNTLIQTFAKELKLKEEELSSDEIFDIPEKYYKIFGKVPFYEHLDKIFNKEFSPNPIHEMLEKLEINYIITTNYDNLIEKKLNKSYEYDVIKKDEDLAHSSKNKMIIKMHGDLKNKNIILKRSDFENYTKKFPLISTFIKGLFTTDTILFIGYSLNDPNVKNMLSWIRKILKEDFRKVYLVDFKSYDKENNVKNEKIVNKIILPNIDKKEYLEISEEKLRDNKGKLLTDFLEDLYKKREEKLKEENNLIYSNLDYLTELNLKNLIKNLNIVDFNTNKILSNKRVASFNKEDKVDLSDLKKHITILIKSNITRFDDNLSINDLMNDVRIKQLIEKQDKLDSLVDYILTFDKKSFIDFIKKNNDISKENLIISGYILFEEYDLASTILQSKLKEYQKDNNKIKTVWTYFLLSNLERIKSYFSFFIEPKEKINLEKIYDKYFKRKTNLFYEIINFQTLEKIRNDMHGILENIKKSKNSSFLGQSPLIKAQLLIRDTCKFILFNGIPSNFVAIHNIFKNYIEIVFILYKNDKDKKNYFIGKILTYERFEYFDYFIMINLSTEYLKNLITDYNINKLETEVEDFSKLLITLKNLLDLFNPDQIHFNGFKNRLENIFLLIYKHDLVEEQFNVFFNILLQSKKFNIFYEDNNVSIYQNLQYKFISILDKNLKFVTENKLKDIFYKIISSQKKSNEYVIRFLTHYYSKIISEEMILTEELQNYFSKNDKIIKVYFLRLFSKEVKAKEIELILTHLEDNFNFQIYFELVNLNYIDPKIHLEKNIILELDKTFLDNNKHLMAEPDLLFWIYELLEKNKISQHLKNNLKKYSNENFKNYLKKYELENEWKYFLDKENFDYNLFSIKDLNSFSEYGIQKIIKEGKNNKKFMKHLYEYLYFNNNNDILKGCLKAMFDIETES